MKASEARAGAAERERRRHCGRSRQQQEYEWQKTLRDKQLPAGEPADYPVWLVAAVAEGKDPQQFWERGAGSAGWFL